MYLYDASAIVNLVKRGEVKAFYNGYTLDLAIYEVTNAIWKECCLLKNIQANTALKLIELISKIFSIMSLYTIRGHEEKVLDLAIKEGITVYDASYIYVAADNKLTLVTDDKKLANVARKYTDTTTSLEIAKAFL